MNAPSPKVLLIEDEKLIRRFVRAAGPSHWPLARISVAEIGFSR